MNRRAGADLKYELLSRNKTGETTTREKTVNFNTIPTNKLVEFDVPVFDVRSGDNSPIK
jgi:hypothetical protein